MTEAKLLTALGYAKLFRSILQSRFKCLIAICERSNSCQRGRCRARMWTTLLCCITKNL